MGVAQLVRASDCGSEGRGFESHHPPQKRKPTNLSVFFFYPSRRLRISSPHIVWCISSAHWAVYHHALACICLRLDDMQHLVLVICNFFEIDDIQGYALIYMQISAKLTMDKAKPICSQNLKSPLKNVTKRRAGYNYYITQTLLMKEYTKIIEIFLVELDAC